MNQFRTKTGFTIVEVVIVLVIIGIMAAMSAFGVQAWVEKNRIRSVKREIVSAMHLGRMRAIACGHDFFIDFDPDDDGVQNSPAFACFLDADDDGDGELNNGLPENANEYIASQISASDAMGDIPVVRLPGQVRYGLNDGVDDINGDAYAGDGVTFTGNRAIFYPNGGGKPGTVYLCGDQAETYAVSVNMIGTVTVRRWNGSDWE